MKLMELKFQGPSPTQTPSNAQEGARNAFSQTHMFE